MVASRPRNSKKTNNKQDSGSTVYIGNLDATFLICTIILVLFGIVMVFSASYYNAFHNSNDRFRYLMNQSVSALVGAAALVFLANVNYRYFKRFTTIAYIGTLVLLALVPFIGHEHGGAVRWITIFGVTFQPSELAKVALILKLSSVISNKKNMLHTLKGTFQALAIVAIPVGLIAISNFSTALIVAMIGMGIIFIASPYTAIFFTLAGAGAASITAYLAFFSDGFRGARFAAWLDPFSDRLGTGFQTVQSLYAIGSGGLFGLGLGQSRQKLGFIPEAHNDIIFSVIVEELGIIGGGLVIFLFGVIIWRAITIAIKTDSLYGSLIATGIAIMLGIQIIINIAVVTNTIPNTGIQLPFISYGGTSLLISMASAGLLLNISRYSKML
ncbi:MAG: putative lipid II flippase FtsW [Defluviitaleaceae bacterium]|nr:putative lipid II flippase FtsW [Defluviitaleaceae bacterium]